MNSWLLASRWLNSNLDEILSRISALWTELVNRHAGEPASPRYKQSLCWWTGIDFFILHINIDRFTSNYQIDQLHCVRWWNLVEIWHFMLLTPWSANYTNKSLEKIMQKKTPKIYLTHESLNASRNWKVYLVNSIKVCASVDLESCYHSLRHAWVESSRRTIGVPDLNLD